MRLKDISWQVNEPTYRADNALSYSTLARFNRDGFNNIERLFEKVESASLTFGSLVDTLITNESEFNDLFFVSEIKNYPSDILIMIIKRLYNTFHEDYSDIEDIPDTALLEAITDIPWNNHWLPKTRVKKIKEDGKCYYSLLQIAHNRIIIPVSDYIDAEKCVEALKTSEATKFYFEQDSPFNDNVQREYQLKFKATFSSQKFGSPNKQQEIDYRCMADEIIVLHDKKLVIPVDLKTSSKPEWDFYKSFVQWQYSIQSRLYWRIIRANMDKDPYFKDFELADYRFIVINRKTLTPLVWEFPDTKKMGDIEVGTHVFRDPFNIAQELVHYLQNTPTVPYGIYLNDVNNINVWLEYEDCY